MTPRDAFLMQFDSLVQPHIIEYANRISGLDADVTMLVARKATCFVECLEGLKLAVLNGIVTSDRILDMDRSWLKGKTVALVDDAVISGTTLCRSASSLEEAGATVEHIAVLCVDKVWWNPDLVQPSRPYLEYTDQEATSLCASIVNAMSVVPRPYCVDFPLFSKIRIPDRDIDCFSGQPNWESANATTSLQETAGDVFSITLTATGRSLARLNDSFGWAVSRHSQIVKLRVYGRRTKAERPVWWCRILPIVALDPLSMEDLSNLWKSLIGHLPNTITRRMQGFTSPESRLRLLHFVLASRLFRLWLKDFEPVMRTTVRCNIDTRSASYCFPPQEASAALEICQLDSPLLGDVPDMAGGGDLGTKRTVQATEHKACNAWSMQASLTEPFTQVYEQEELAARKLAKRYGRRVFDKPVFRESVDRLRRGFSLPQLRRILADRMDAGRAARTVSSFLDLAIDRGIVVPVTMVDGNAAFRAYRHGEDVRFGRVEERLCCLMLAQMQEASERQYLPKTWTEKAFALLIRAGVEMSFLSRWAGNLGYQGTVGIRYSLHGAVVQSNAPKLYAHNPEGALTNMLMESHALEESGLGYRVAEIPEAPASQDAEGHATIIGQILGQLLESHESGTTPGISPRELTLIASITYPNDAAGALAAEVDIFNRNWARTSRWLSQKVGQQKGRIQVRNQLRREVGFTAVNNGAWKFRSFMTGKVWDIVERIADDWEDVVYKSSWGLLWPEGKRQSGAAIPPILASIIARQGWICLAANSGYRLIELACVCDGSPMNTQDKKRRDDLIAEIKDFCKQLSLHCRDTDGRNLRARSQRAVSRVQKGHALESKFRRDIFEFMDLLAWQARQVLAEVDAAVTSIGRPRPITRFSHAMHIHVAPRGDTGGADTLAVENILASVRARARKGTRGRRPCRIDVLPHIVGGFAHGRWVCASGPMARKWLVTGAKEIFEQISQDAEVRAAIFSHLPMDSQVIHAGPGSEYVSPRFWDSAHDILDGSHGEWSGSALLLLVPAGEDSGLKDLKNEVKKEFGDTLVKGRKAEQITLPLPVPHAFLLEHCPYRVPHRSGRLFMEPRQCTDVGILTVVTEETQAVVEALDSTGGCAMNEGRADARLYYCGSFDAAGGKRHRVAATQALQQGNRAIIAAYNMLVSEFSPRLIVLLGIAGAIHKDVRLCDVVICTQSVYYENRKIEPTGIKHRGEGYKIDASVVLRLNHFFVSHGEPAEFKAHDESVADTFKVLRGPIGTGEAVVGYREAEIRAYLEAFNDKTLVLETESGGVAQAFYEERIKYGSKPIAYVVVRGISDHADKKKDDAYRKPAACNAVTALQKFLATIPNLARALDSNDHHRERNE